ncbi:serine protease [Legionella pneumophila serogroup 1]|nr:trypsin-like peptidase domain-containing protein [Legionella pneumophila]HDO9973316.1 trypsin-like peptidase domain-containing protein [Legionella pneumophila]
MALIPPFFLNAVVSIGMVNQNQTHWIGTGFIVGRPMDDSASEDKKYHTFLVTNKHVLLNKGQVLIRFNSLSNSSCLDYPVDLVVNHQPIWTGHPSDSVDIAAFLINPNTLTKSGAEFSFFSLEQHTMTNSAMETEGVSEGDGVFILGFPMGIMSSDRKYVVARSGIIARIRDMLDGHQENYLIDSNIFPGNSGGPVVLRPEITAIEGTKSHNKAALIGIVKSYVPYQDVAISQQTGRPRVIFEENSGLAEVECVDNIISTIELCYNKRGQAS